MPGLLTGHLTRKEQVVLGITLATAVRPCTGANEHRMASFERKQRAQEQAAEILAQFGLSWVTERLASPNGVRPKFSAADMTDQAVRFDVSEESISWLQRRLAELPRVDYVIGEVEDRLFAIVAGTYRLPAELAPAAAVAAVPPAAT